MPYQTPDKCYERAPVRKLNRDERMEMVMLAIADDSYLINCEMLDRFGIKSRSGKIVGFSAPAGFERPLDVIRKLKRRPLGSWVPPLPADSPLGRSTMLPYARFLRMPYSEVCMHMKIANKWMWVTPIPYRSDQTPLMVQLWDENGVKFSAPITTGEAGWFERDAHGYVPCNVCGINRATIQLDIAEPYFDAREMRCMFCGG